MRVIWSIHKTTESASFTLTSTVAILMAHFRIIPKTQTQKKKNLTK